MSRSYVLQNGALRWVEKCAARKPQNCEDRNCWSRPAISPAVKGYDSHALKLHRRDQAILQRAVRPLDPALGLRRVGTDDLDVEHFERTPEVGYAIALGRGGIVAEHRVLVRVERHRLAVHFDVLAGRLHVGEGALALDHLELHQLVCGSPQFCNGIF